MREREIEITWNGQDHAGYFCSADDDEVRPGVLICPTIRGRTAFEEQKARELAALGYAALCIDLYGTHTRDASFDTWRELMMGYLSDREGLAKRLRDWHDLLGSQPEIDADKTAAIGFCFGGLCALDLARSGAALRGAVSFHGLLDVRPGVATTPIDGSVLVLHGWDDPLAPPDKLEALAGELTAAGADWQIHAYGNTLHAFTNPAAQDSNAGTVYDANADRRSHAAMREFLAEVLGG